MRRALGGVLVVGFAIGLAGCGFGGPDPQPTADAAARALGRHDVHTVEFTGPDAKRATTDLAAMLDGMDQVPSTATASDVEQHGDSATATLTWHWDVAGRTWTTRSPMTLEKAGDAWHVVWRPSLVHPRLKPGQTLQANTLVAPRGDILGAHGAKIVTPRDVVRYGIDKVHVPHGDAVASARALATLVGVDPAGFAKRVRKAGEKAFVEAITLRSGSPDAPKDDAVRAIDGAAMVKAKLPLAPTRTFAAPILGTVGTPTAEMVKESKGTLSAADQVGLSGLQARYEDELGGSPGVRVDLLGRDAATEPTELFRTDPKSGTALTTTLDVRAQNLAERALAGTTSPSALVAVRPSTGDILAAASGPASNGYNTATYARYAPGSTFKIVSSLALLRSGVTPSTLVDCPPTVTVDGKRFKNYDDYPPSELGRIPFRTAIANSCNTAVIGQRDRLGRNTLTGAAEALGLGVDHDLGFPAYFGSAPPAGSETEGAADLIGQGKVQASPLTMATVAASVEKGAVVVPRLLPDHEPAAGEAHPAQPLTGGEAGRLRDLMRAVVTDGSGRLLADLPGAPVLAKTGTAEYGQRAPLRTHAWMIAIHGDLAVAVFVEDGESGSGTAGPILKQFLLGMPGR